MNRIMFIGQAMPRGKRDPHDWPSLNVWLYSLNLSHEQIVNNFHYSALVDYFPGSKGSSHIVPTHNEIVKEQERLKKDIFTFDPDIIVPSGRLSIAYCFNEAVKPLKEYIGKTFNINPYDFSFKEILVIPLPHPSGASTWYHKKEHKDLLNKALQAIKANLS